MDRALPVGDRVQRAASDRAQRFANREIGDAKRSRGLSWKKIAEAIGPG
jgi:hypothetical protein